MEECPGRNVVFVLENILCRAGESGQLNMTCRNRLWKEGRSLTVLGRHVI